ncbi:MAG: apolipoprotein acyltransferase [Sedimentitalea sp.]
MLVIGGAMLGAGLGAMTARKRGGKPLDMAQYAAGYGIALGLLGMIATIIIHRAAV